METEPRTDLEEAIREAVLLHGRGQGDEALARLRVLHAGFPREASIRYLLGALELEAGRPAAARPHLEAVMKGQPTHGQAAALLGSAYRQLGADDAAVELWHRFLMSSPEDLRGRLNFIEALLHRGDKGAAAAQVRALPDAVRDMAEAQLTLGLMLQAAEEPEAAIPHYRRCLEIHPGDTLARRNLAAALQQTGQLDEAERLYQGLLDDNPDDAELLRNMGTLRKDRDDLSGGLAYYARAMRSRRTRLAADEVTAAGRDPALRETTMHSLRLELEQLQHLAENSVPVEDLDRLIEGYRQVIDALDGVAPEGRRFTLPWEHFRTIGEAMHRLVNLEPAEGLPGGALNPALDVTALVAEYRENGPGIAVADDLLRPEALAALRRYLHRSTIWFGYGKARGYCGSYMEDGFGCGLLMQIATELRERLPEILGPHHLNQMWAYIYDQRMQGITAHADPATVNLNFWITPDEANLAPGSGGLIVSRTEAPREWNFDEYNNRPEILDRYVSGEDRVVVPHRCNRMVMFNSNLVHKTDDFSFRPGFTSRRINVTMLFGWRQAGR
jgi:tetratricopeptide (TPR) repeat protein